MRERKVKKKILAGLLLNLLTYQRVGRSGSLAYYPR